MSLPTYMQAMVLESQGRALVAKELPIPRPQQGQVLIQVIACGVCRTDLHVLDGDLKNPKLPLVLGHEIIGRIVGLGREVSTLHQGDIVGVPWLAYTCGSCVYCRNNRENLCANALFTGYTVDGGFAEYTVANERYCFAIPSHYAGPAGTPLLCAGLIGYRSYCMLDPNATQLGLYGFGAAAHLLIQLARHQGKKIYAFTRDQDLESQAFARKLGASWAGGSSTPAPVPLDGAIIFAPVGSLVPKALKDLDKAGTVVCGGIHMSDIPSFSYDLLWEERIVRSVANLTRKDGQEYLQLAAEVPIEAQVQVFKLSQANEALENLRKGQIHGAAVLAME
jgi:alcohol dehydrogenase, propanol-preferring